MWFPSIQRKQKISSINNVLRSWWNLLGSWEWKGTTNGKKCDFERLSNNWLLGLFQWHSQVIWEGPSSILFRSNKGTFLYFHCWLELKSDLIFTVCGTKLQNFNQFEIYYQAYDKTWRPRLSAAKEWCITSLKDPQMHEFPFQFWNSLSHSPILVWRAGDNLDKSGGSWPIMTPSPVIMS